MGGKKDDTPAVTAPPPVAESPDYMAMMQPIMGFMVEQSAMTQAMIQQQTAAQAASKAPEPTNVLKMDYAAENKAIQDKLKKQVDAEDVKRKGVLGTILTSLSDEEEPDTVTSLLSGKAK